MIKSVFLKRIVAYLNCIFWRNIKNIDFGIVIVMNTKKFEGRSTPLLSIVMPVHNPQEYLSLCLDSVLNQTMSDFELITIDDASSDNSYNTLKKYEKKDYRVSVYKNESSIGAAKTRNKGLDLARGEFIIFLDSDDYFEPDFFEKMLNAIMLNNADIAICDIYWRDEQEKSEYAFNKKQNYMSSLLKNPFHPEDFDCIIFYGMPFAPFNKVIRRKFLVEKEIRFQDLPNSNDVFFGILATAVASLVVYVPYSLVHYRYNTGCQISSKTHKNPLCICFAFIKIREELHKRKLWIKFRKMYYDVSVPLFQRLTKTKEDSNLTLDYIRSEEGCNNLGFNNLGFNDFSDINNYCDYLCLMDNKFRKFRKFSKLLFIGYVRFLIFLGAKRLS